MILAILQARMSSTRLPGKVLKRIKGRPMLELQIERLLRAKRVDRLIVATSKSVDDDGIDQLSKRIGIDCFRGSLEDVLDRFYQAAKPYSPDYIVRLTGDCPLHDPALVDEMIAACIDGKYDFVTNTIEPTYPDGLDAWVFTFRTLEKTWSQAQLQSEREHVCPYMISHPELFRTLSYKNSSNLSNMRWTVDEINDFNFVEKVYEAFYSKDPIFSTNDILTILKKEPEKFLMNTSLERDEGLAKSQFYDRQANHIKKGICIDKSMDVQRRAKACIPGQTQLLSKRIDQFSDGIWPGYYSKAKGVDIWDMDGNQYIDMSIGGIGATVLGYADDDVDEAVIKAIRNGVASSLSCPEEVQLAELLCELHPWAEKVRFTKAGGEAMAVAVRIARAFSKKDKIAFCGYHGWQDWYLSANLGTSDALSGHLLPGLDTAGVPQNLAGTMLPFHYNCFDELEKIFSSHGRDIGVIVMEPIRNDEPIPGFLENVRRIADESGAVLIFDEITAAFRLNSAGSHMLHKVFPDIAVFAKAIANGYPMAAIIGKEKIMDAAQKSFISSTNWTERTGPAAALATIRKFQKLDASQHLIACGKSIQDGWKEAGKKHGLAIHVGGIFPLSHFTFDSDHLTKKAYFIQLMLQKGFLASNLFYSMHAHRPWQIQAYLKEVNRAFEDIAAAEKSGEIKNKLFGKPASSGFKRLN